MSQTTTQPGNPKGWPQELQPYNPGKHRAIHSGYVLLYPYDCTTSRVKSWVVIQTGGRYLGIISRCQLPDNNFPGEQHPGYDGITANGKHRITSLDRNEVINYLANHGI